MWVQLPQLFPYFIEHCNSTDFLAGHFLAIYCVPPPRLVWTKEQVEQEFELCSHLLDCCWHCSQMSVDLASLHASGRKFRSVAANGFPLQPYCIPSIYDWLWKIQDCTWNQIFQLPLKVSDVNIAPRISTKQQLSGVNWGGPLKWGHRFRKLTFSLQHYFFFSSLEWFSYSIYLYTSFLNWNLKMKFIKIL